MDINLTGHILSMPIKLTGQITSQSGLWDSQIIGVIVGGLIASITSYFLDRNKERHEYRKDLAEAVRKAYSNFLAVTFKGAYEKIDMPTYLLKLREAYGPVYLLGDKKIIKNISTVLNGSLDIWYGPSTMSEKEKSDRITEIMQAHVNELSELMQKTVQEGPDYLVKHWWQFWK